MKKAVKFGIFFLLIAILLVGCAKQPGVQQGQKKCSDLNGFACKTNEACNGRILSAADTNSCCNVKCEAKAAVGDVEVPKFDFGKATDNLGSLQ